MVASGLGYCLVGRSVCEGSRGDVTFVPLSDVQTTAELVAVTKGPTSKVVAAFVEALVQANRTRARPAE